MMNLADLESTELIRPGARATYAQLFAGDADVEQDRADDIAAEVAGVGWAGDATDRAGSTAMFDAAHKDLGGLDGDDGFGDRLFCRL